MEIRWQEYGLDAGWLLPVFSYEDWLNERRAGRMSSHADYIREDPRADLPGANALLLLLKAYRPVRGNVSGYYFASHQSYMSARALIDALHLSGIPAAMARVPLRETALRAGIGTRLHSGLMSVPPFGTRFALQGVLLELEDGAPACTPPPEAPASPCLGCGACERACPSGALDASGFHHEKCLRSYMEGDAMPVWVMDRLPSLLGCELCQSVCPVNGSIPPRELSAEEASAFSYETLLRAELKPALSLVGKNQKKQYKLTAQAAVLAAREGRRDLLPLLRELREVKKEEPLQRALAYAVRILEA